MERRQGRVLEVAMANKDVNCNRLFDRLTNPQVYSVSHSSVSGSVIFSPSFSALPSEQAQLVS